MHDTGRILIKVQREGFVSVLPYDRPVSFVGMLKKAASGVLAFSPCSRTERTLRASKRLRPCWTDFFEHSLGF